MRRYDKNSPAHASLTASVVIPYAGDWSVSVTQGTYNVQHFLGSPHLITVAAAATDPASCTTKLSSNLEVGGLLTASISTFDLLGNPTADPSDALTYWLNDDSTPVLLDGNTVSAQVDVPGLQLLHVAVNGVEIGGSPCVRQRSKPRCAANSLHRTRFAPRRYSFSVTGDLACPPGFTPVDNACMRCANGFVKLEATSAPCSACLSFVAGSVDTDPVRTPDSADSCICPTGFVLFESGCVECPEGTECAAPGVNVLTLPLEAGYWRASNESMEVLQCGEVDACTPAECEDRNEEIEEQTGGAAEDCSYYEEYCEDDSPMVNSATYPYPEGWLATHCAKTCGLCEEGGGGGEMCAENHVGPLCELCENGFAAVQGSCVECKGGGSAVALAGVIVVLAMTAALVAWFVRRNGAKVKKWTHGSGMAAVKAVLA